jgi:hypothetical protein
MVIIYDSVLTEPPSSVHCFRDVTLYTNVFLKKDNILCCPKGMKSIYWKWIKSYGAHDFIEEIIITGEKQEGLTVGIDKQVNCDYINEFNLHKIIDKIELIVGR